MPITFDENHIEQIEKHGLAVEKVQKQIEIFEKGAPYVDLDRPCTVRDGIQRLNAEEINAYADLYEKENTQRNLMKFVPASGAATRMFKALTKISGDYDRIQRETIAQGAAEGNDDCQEVLVFLDNIDQFAFYGQLSEKMKKDGHDVESLRHSGDFTLFVTYVLTEKGLNYANKPKGQIMFHHYPDGPRTAFEEHLVEAAKYAKDGDGNCFLHFTVSPEHEGEFSNLLKKTGPVYEKAYNVRFNAGFSHQHPSTDTIAVDMENRPFQDKNGNLLFRPGGHGALLDNLNDLRGDIVFIKNIDNVVPDSLKAETVLWKKVLAGFLLTAEKEIRAHYHRIRQADVDESSIVSAENFVEKMLSIKIPEQVKNKAVEERRRFLIDRFDRPLRVCGMVPSSGEAGGGPFWVKSPDGGLSIQIVESAQIDPDSSAQCHILKTLTHFNPVDIVCSLRNHEQEPYDLMRFVDASTVFISQKSKDGRKLKALEHPGLWNGSMAYWNTVFIEVPLITFNPVKTVNDLLRETHQA